MATKKRHNWYFTLVTDKKVRGLRNGNAYVQDLLDGFDKLRDIRHRPYKKDGKLYRWEDEHYGIISGGISWRKNHLTGTLEYRLMVRMKGTTPPKPVIDFCIGMIGKECNGATFVRCEVTRIPDETSDEYWTRIKSKDVDLYTLPFPENKDKWIVGARK